MPNIKAAKKALKQDKKKASKNAPLKAELKTLLKKTRQAIAKKEVSAADELMQKFQKAADKAAKKRIIHANTASRYKSNLGKQLSAIKAAPKEAEKK